MLLDSALRYGSRSMNGDHGFFVDVDEDGIEETTADYASNDDQRTEAEAIAQCAAMCGSDYQYVGLQWRNECWCDNDDGYASRGRWAGQH